VKTLCKEQTLRREKTPGAAADVTEIIALPSVPPETAQPWNVVPIRRAA
jgi:hypothetical protein